MLLSYPLENNFNTEYQLNIMQNVMQVIRTLSELKFNAKLFRTKIFVFNEEHIKGSNLITTQQIREHIGNKIQDTIPIVPQDRSGIMINAQGQWKALVLYRHIDGRVIANYNDPSGARLKPFECLVESNKVTIDLSEILHSYHIHLVDHRTHLAEGTASDSGPKALISLIHMIFDPFSKINNQLSYEVYPLYRMIHVFVPIIFNEKLCNEHQKEATSLGINFICSHIDPTNLKDLIYALKHDMPLMAKNPKLKEIVPVFQSAYKSFASYQINYSIDKTFELIIQNIQEQKKLYIKDIKNKLLKTVKDTTNAGKLTTKQIEDLNFIAKEEARSHMEEVYQKIFISPCDRYQFCKMIFQDKNQAAKEVLKKYFPNPHKFSIPQVKYINIKNLETEFCSLFLTDEAKFEEEHHEVLQEAIGKITEDDISHI